MTTHTQDTEPDRPAQELRGGETGTVSDRVKRAGGLVLGSVLFLRGLRQRSVRGIVVALLGAGVLARTLRNDTGRDGDHGARLARRRSETDRFPDANREASQPMGAVASRSVTIGESADELYEAWRDPEMFSQVMGQFAEVTSTGEDRHRWTVQGPGDTDLSWETRIVEAEPGEVVRWETVGDSSVSGSGSVRFRPAPDDRGTVVTLSLDFDPPGGALGNAVVQRLGIVPETLAGHALGRFKSLLESGEIPTLTRNPSGRGTGDLL